MILHENKKLFEQAIRATSKYLTLNEIFIEKDYWVTLALKKIFNSEAKDYTVFKGGTSLSKCFRLIERFSEDIDVVIIHNEEDSSNQKRSKIKKISKAVDSPFLEIEVPNLTSKRGMIRKTCHEYPKSFKGDFGQVRKQIIVEASWLGYFEPFEELYISSYIYEMLKKQNQKNYIEKYEMAPFLVKVLSLKRTLCEKIMSLVRFSYGINYFESIQNLKMKIRHIYDLYLLLNEKEIFEFFISDNFERMLCRVGKDDKKGYRNNNQWINNHPSNALIFSDLENVWSKLKNIYEKDFSRLVYGKLPNEKDIYFNLLKIKQRIEKIKWDDVKNMQVYN